MTEPTPEAPPALTLAPADQSALDALVEAGFDPEAVASDLKPRARRLASVLETLEPTVGGSDSQRASDRSALIDVTLARAARAPRLPVDRAGVDLCDADKAAIDALVDAGWSHEAVPRHAHERAKRADRLLAAAMGVEQPFDIDSDDRDDRVARTLDRVWRARNAEIARGIGAGSGRSRFSLRDIAGVAAILLIGASIVWPTVSNLRFEARRADDARGLQNAAVGFNLYSQEHRGQWPHLRKPAAESGPWWEVGRPERSHSANLFTLVTGDYATLEDLASAGNPMAPIMLDLSHHRDWRRPEEVSYSYQLLTPNHPRFDPGRRLVVLTDRSPVIQRARRGEAVNPYANSMNHRGRGQHILFTDGSLEWATSPIMPDGDNIWLPAALERITEPLLRGVERPETADDAFVGP